MMTVRSEGTRLQAAGYAVMGLDLKQIVPICVAQADVG